MGTPATPATVTASAPAPMRALMREGMSSRAFHAWPIDTAIRAVPRSTTFIAAVASGTPTPATAVVAMMATGTSTSRPALL